MVPARRIRSCSRRRSVLARLILATALLISVDSTDRAHAEDGRVREGRLKAACLYYIAKFVQWENAPSEPTEPLRFCLIGEDPLNEYVESTVDGKLVRGRSIQIKNLPRPPRDEQRGCDIIFLGEPAQTFANQLPVDSPAYTHVVTVSAGQPELSGKVMIEITKDSNKLHLVFNQPLITKQNLKVSSDLLQLGELREK